MEDWVDMCPGEVDIPELEEVMDDEGDEDLWLDPVEEYEAVILG